MSRLVSIFSEQKVLMGRPSHVPPEAIVSALTQAIDHLPQCLEAHFPQYFVVGAMQEPRQVLVLVVRDDENQEDFAQKARNRVLEYLSDPTPIDIWVMVESDPMLPAVRKATCSIGSS